MMEDDLFSGARFRDSSGTKVHVPIYTDGPRVSSQPDSIMDYQASYGDITGAAAWQGLDSGVSWLAGIAEIERAKGFDYSHVADPAAAPAFAEPPRIDRDAARQRVKDAGLHGIVKVDDGPDMIEPVLDIMISRARERREREVTIQRGPQGVLPTALTVGTSFLVGAVDPLNVASAFIPVIGELRYAKLLAGAGESFAARTGVRMGVGAASGVVGQAVLEPLDWYAHTQDGRDFGMADVLHNLVFGAALGGSLHSIGGGVRDVYRARKGLAQYPFGPGEPLDRGEPLGAPDATALDILRDLPPRAQEDSMRAALAAIVDGEPVKVGEMLHAAAHTDPRIAEAFQPENIRAATIEHEGRIYEAASHEEAIGKLEVERGFHLADIADDAMSPGFATTKGRVIGVEEALRIAKRNEELLGPTTIPSEATSNAAPHIDQRIAGAFQSGPTTIPGEATSIPHDVMADPAEVRRVNAARPAPDVIDPSKSPDAASWGGYLKSLRQARAEAYATESLTDAGVSISKLPHSVVGRTADIISKEGVPFDARVYYSLGKWSGHVGPKPSGERALSAFERAVEEYTGLPARPGGVRRSPEELFRELSATRADMDDPVMFAASRDAEALPEQIQRNLDKRVEAATRAEALTNELFDMFADRLPEHERQRVDDRIKSLEDDLATRAEAIKRSGACLFGARGN